MDALAIIEALQLGAIERNIATILAKRFGQWVDSETLVASAYAGTRNEPRDPVNATKAVANLLRRKLLPHRLAIEGMPYHGRRMVEVDVPDLTAHEPGRERMLKRRIVELETELIALRKELTQARRIAMLARTLERI